MLLPAGPDHFMPSKSHGPAVPTARMRAFIREYCVDHNGAAAARRAGYSAHTAREIAYRLLQRVDVQVAVAEREEASDRLTGSRRHYVLNSLQAIAASAMADPKSLAVAVTALKALGDHEGLFRQTLEIRVQGAVETMCEGVRSLMSAQSYAELVAALEQITGVPPVAPAPTHGAPSSAVH